MRVNWREFSDRDVLRRRLRNRLVDLREGAELNGLKLNKKVRTAGSRVVVYLNQRSIQKLSCAYGQEAVDQIISEFSWIIMKPSFSEGFKNPLKEFLHEKINIYKATYGIEAYRGDPRYKSTDWRRQMANCHMHRRLSLKYLIRACKFLGVSLGEVIDEYYDYITQTWEYDVSEVLKLCK